MQMKTQNAQNPSSDFTAMVHPPSKRTVVEGAVDNDNIVKRRRE